MVKQLTGGDIVSARFLFGEYFDFSPTFKLWMAANYKPNIRRTDHAIWRRIKLIPFSVTIPDDRQDKNFEGKLKAELPGILAWAVQGCLEWQRAGLQTPDEVKDATNEYRAMRWMLFKRFLKNAASSTRRQRQDQVSCMKDTKMVYRK